MERYFYDKTNFNNINEVIEKTVFNKTGQHVDPKHTKLVYQLMNYVYKNTTKPAELKKKQYLSLLNHQVIQIAVPRIEQMTVQQNSARREVYDGNVGNVGNVGGGVVQPVGQNVSMMNNYLMPTMNAETKDQYNINERFEQIQKDREQIGGQMGEQMGRQQVTSDNAMSIEDSNSAYEQMLQRRKNGTTVQNLAQRNQSMEQFENRQNRINHNVQQYSEKIEGGEEGESINSSTINEQFQPILGSHPAETQSAGGLNSIMKQDVETLLAKRLDQNVIVRNNGDFDHKAFSSVSVNRDGENGNGIEPMIEKMTGTNMADVVTQQDYEKAENMKMNAFKQQMVIPPIPTEKYIKREYYINIDSRDRDLEIYPNVNRFQIKFSPSSDSNDMFQYTDVAGNVLYETRKTVFGDGHGASLPDIFENIYSVECVSATIPYDITYVCGICPYQHNSYQIDQNMTATGAPNQFTSWPYGPVYNTPSGALAGSNLGIATSVLDEPYLLLNVDELEGNNPYIGTNKTTTNTFAKLLHDGYFGVLTSFIQLKTGYSEKKLYKPQALGSIDKMTLNLLKHNGIHYNFGNDKLFVKKFLPVNGDACSTQIIIIPPEDDCGDCGKSQGHCLRPGNLIYMYDTMDCVNNEILFYKNVQPVLSKARELGEGSNSTLVIDEEEDNDRLVITATVVNSSGVTRSVNLGSFIDVGDYLTIVDSSSGTKYYSRVSAINGGGDTLITERPDGYIEAGSKVLGFSKKNMKGINSNNKGAFNYIDGKRVCATVDEDITSDGETFAANTSFLINFPYKNLPKRLKNVDLEFGSSGQSEIFFIKKRMQVSYTLRITTLEQNINNVPSSMI